MASFTPCCKKPPPELERVLLWRWAVGLLLWCWLCCAALWPAPLRAEPAPEALELRLQSSADGLHLSTLLPLELPVAVEDALSQGIPLFFLAEAQVLRERWYWSAQKLAQTTRYMRLSYQPLTRRWRLAVSPSPIDRSGLGVVPGHNYDSLEDVLAVMKRIAHWKIADTPALISGEQYNVQLLFRLDTAQLPRALQVGTLGRPNWSLAWQGSQRVIWEPAP